MAFSLHGFPVKTTLFFGNSLRVDSNVTPILSAYLVKYLLDNPTTEFCSWINVFLPNFLAAHITGPVTYPPAPITTSGENSLIIFLHY